MNAPRDRRLPSLGIDVWDAPAPPRPKGQTYSGGDLETNVVSFKPTASFHPETVLFATSKRWRAIDVYVQLPANFYDADPAAVRVKIYAHTGVGRHLISSGFSPRIWGSSKQSPQWACAGRSVATRFEVAVSVINAHASSDEVRVSYVASDEAVAPPPNLGVIPVREGVSVGGLRAFGGGLTQAAITSLETEVVRAVAFNTAAANRWFVVVDEDAVGAGLLAYASIIVPASQSVIIPHEQLCGKRFGSAGLTIGGSSTPGSLTDSVDVTWSAWIR